MKNLFAYLLAPRSFSVVGFICLFVYFFFLPSPSFAIPGQLIYDINVPDVTNQPAPPTSCDAAIVPYKNESERNNTNYKTCLLQKSQLEKKNMTMASDIVQEKNKAFVLEIALVFMGVVSVVSFIFCLVFLKKSLSITVPSTRIGGTTI